MAAGQHGKSLVNRRRRARRDSEDEESVASEGGYQSEASATTGGDDDDKAGGSIASDAESSPATAQSDHKEQRGISDKRPQSPSASQAAADAPKHDGKSSPAPKTTFDQTADTKVMINGAAAIPSRQQDPEDFDAFASETPKTDSRQESFQERRRREQEEYERKRESDPTFIPSRGNFFMHDPRTSDHRGFTVAAGRGRGRGRGHIGGPLPLASFASGPRAAESPWTHDLHDSINEPNIRQQPRGTTMFNRAPPFPHNQAAAARVAPQTEYRPLSFSTSKLLGKAQVRVYLPTMKAAVPFSAVPIKQYTRLPDHRPPLRRDKPVRISLPDKPPRYIFPAQDRSFIFIPRAMRPNQQGYGRSRSGYGPSSRRTSAYGGSAYTPSIAMSRRSSIARDVGREHMFSPAASINARQMAVSRPVVRLPHGMSHPASVASPAGSVVAGPHQPFPLPQTPAIEHYRDAMTMHQPRPQKTISVSGIDSPAALSMHAPQQQDQQPFENQLPHHVASGSFGSMSQLGHAPPPYYGYQPQAGTPLSHIPERAIHAQPFQPPMSGYGPPMYGQYQPGPYFYPAMPVFVPQGGPQPPSTNEPGNAQASTSMMAQEANGMVYYVDPSQVPTYGQGETYPSSGQEGDLQPPSYTVAGMGGMMTPSPEASWYYQPTNPGTVYYPQSG